jgi:hypothetical protein
MSDEETLNLIVTGIQEAINSQKIILFGSWARGEDSPHSDIDLLIIKESTLPRTKHYAQVRRLFWGCSYLCAFPGIKTAAHFIDRDRAFSERSFSGSLYIGDKLLVAAQ